MLNRHISQHIYVDLPAKTYKSVWQINANNTDLYAVSCAKTE